MKTIYLLQGLPASGKSTWARERLAENPGNVKRVNKDDLRDMIDDGRWSRSNEKLILKMRDHLVREALREGSHVIVDDTNLHDKHEARMKQLAAEHRKATGHDVRVEMVDHFLDVDLETCAKRDLARCNSVGREVIEDMYYKYVAEKREIDYREQDESLPRAIVVDVDGTLALLNGRDPYDRDFLNDPPHEPIVNLVRLLQERFSVICVSGRMDTHRSETVEWLTDYGIAFHSLHMREEGDYRKDVRVKREIFEEYIEDKWNVVMVLDDRQQTVDGWRELRLPTLQVADGNF